MTRLVGPRGLSVLIFFAVVALALAFVGWFQRNGATVGPLPNFSSQIAVHLVVKPAPQAARPGVIG